MLAWGVEGYVVSFIAPHSLTARALVVAPADELTINNASREEPVEVHVDGRPTLELPPGEDIHVEFGLTPRDARPDPGRVVLPPPARALRPPRALTAAKLQQLCAESAQGNGGSGPIRRDPLVDPCACFTNCASRTSC